MTTDTRIDRILTLLEEAKEGARRFHKDTLGDVDPDCCFGDFLATIKTAAGTDFRRSRQAHDRLTTHYKAALVGTAGATGGYVVPPQFKAELEQTADEYAIFRPRCLVVPMESQTLTLHLPDATTAQSAGTAPWFGGLLLSWTQDATTRPETEPQFRAVELHAWDLAGYALASNNLVADGQALNEALLTIFAHAKAWYEDYACLQGTGVGQPKGIVSATSSKTVTRNTSSHVKIQDTQAMIAGLLPACYERAVWLAHPSVLADLTAITGWIPNGPLQVHGRPVVVTDKCSTLGTRGDLLLVDPFFYVIGERQEMVVSVTAEEPTAYLKSQSVFRLLARLDGQPWFNNVITLPDATTTCAPSVVLV